MSSGEGGVSRTNFQLLMLSPNQLKSYIPYVEVLLKNFLTKSMPFQVVLEDYK